MSSEEAKLEIAEKSANAKKALVQRCRGERFWRGRVIPASSELYDGVMNKVRAAIEERAPLEENEVKEEAD